VAPFVNYAELGKHEAAAPVRGVEPGGVIRVPMAGLVRNFDPSRMPMVEDSQVRGNVFEPLLRDAGAARVEPWLAERWEPAEGGRKYSFRLRDDVRFHDGRRLTARDVRYSLERVLRLSAAESATWLYLPILGVQDFQEGRSDGLAGFHIESDRDFTIELEERVSFLPVLLATDLVTIIPDGSQPQGSGWRDGLVGTGPFRVTTFAPGERLVLERNPQYWRSGYPRADRLEFRFGVPPAEILAGFREGRYSLAADLFPGDAVELRRDAKFGRCYHEIPALNSYFAACNVHRGPLRDAELRRRFFAAVDLPRLVGETLHGLAQPASGLIPPGLLGHDPRRPTAERPGPRPHDRPSPSEIELSVAINPVFRSEYASFCDRFFDSLRAAGFEIRVATRRMAEFQEATMQGTVDLSLGRWNADYPDADSFAYTLNREDGWLGRLCGSEEFDRLIADARVEPDPQARHAIYRRLEERLAREHILLPLFTEQIYRFSRPEVEGLRLRYMSPPVAYENLRIR
jgi:oligopeptide transport system substrate-binding protein